MSKILAIDPTTWLGLSLLLVAISLTALLVAAYPALQELTRAAHSAEKLFDTLTRELPPTLDAIRLTGAELTDLTDELNEGVSRAGNVVKQVDQGIQITKQQVVSVSDNTRSLISGLQAAWQVLAGPPRERPVSSAEASSKDDGEDTDQAVLSTQMNHPNHSHIPIESSTPQSDQAVVPGVLENEDHPESIESPQPVD